MYFQLQELEAAHNNQELQDLQAASKGYQQQVAALEQQLRVAQQQLEDQSIQLRKQGAEVAKLQGHLEGAKDDISLLQVG
jgi:peptidoglycan hydrolase CwlO-like protein